jgi:hypothetical protein
MSANPITPEIDAPCALKVDFGNGSRTSSVVAGTVCAMSKTRVGIAFDRWEIEAFDLSGVPLACDAIVDIFAVEHSLQSENDPTLDRFASITASEQLTLSSQSKNTATSLTGWAKAWPAGTLFRAKLVSVSGSPAKIAIAVRGSQT